MKPPDEDDYESFEGPGFLLERHGRFLRTTSTLSAEGHAEMRRQMAASVPDIRREMADDAEKLYGILHRYRPEAMIGAMWLRNSAFGSAEADTASDDGTRSHAFVEYVATLYVRDAGSGREYVVPLAVLEDVQSRVQSLFASTMWLWMAQDARRVGLGRDKNLEDLRFLTFDESLFVRYPGYHRHLVTLLQGIHTELHRDLGEYLGWDIDDAVRVAESVTTLVDDRLNETLAVAHAAMLENRVDSMEVDERKRWLYGLTARTHFRMQDIAAFTVEEIAEASGVAGGRAQALLEAAHLPWGSCTEDWYAFPHPTPPLQRRPVLRLEEGPYFVPNPTSLLWAIRHIVEEALKKDESEDGRAWWHRYEKARSDYTQAHAVDLLARAMPHARAFHSLKYPWAEDGEKKLPELDGLVIADDVALLIEVKAGGMSVEGRRGAPDGMQEDLKALVGEPHEQALRARDYLKSADRVDFWLRDGSGITVESGKLDDLVLVTVTLDALDVFTATLHKLTDVGVVGGEDLPWAVSLFDLEVITEALEFPAQFIHFLRRRTRLNQIACVMAHDELDWFGHYLREGLYFDDLADPADSGEPQAVINFIGYSEDLDAHFTHDERERGDPPPLPRQQMPEEMGALLEELEEGQHHGYLHLSLALLDLSAEAREQFFAGMAEVLRRTGVDGRHHEFAMVLASGKGGLTFVSDTDRESLRSVLSGYCRLKMYQARCSEWVGIGRLVPSDSKVDEAIVLRKEWEYDEELERLTSEWLQPLPQVRQGAAGGATW